MKKLLALILCAMLLAGCTETEVDSIDSGVEITETAKEVKETESET